MSSVIQYDKEGKVTGFIRPDAVLLFQASTLKSALSLYLACKILPTRGVTVKSMLTLTTKFSNKTYTSKQIPQAISDLEVWIFTMKAALPTEIK